ncbi:uncharacterized protein DUF488 [Isoptericola sp. CG 20/1183]|uniref:Uncharacterized protein DUF488 n=1 Tax=Isoptericola halotolerans TaxID=300560 RepID=A0ABX5EHY0_9MICO|nr:MULTISPECIES: DUF488 domain-containing protein [Isoptericola]PRZ08708.1 uncharacterized protein DUF488 [Isoptericola halotolerans]PRZ10845.1 uncharacterized protein DUF488 [Isoptericola sp. CG 20/1183]
MDATPGEIWTIGHWSCPRAAFLETLRAAHVELVADVRRMPGSRRSPQFDAEEMTGWLADAGIGYQHLTELAGRRPKQRDVDPDLNAGWQNASFKNYADYTLTAPFETGLERLAAQARERPVAVLCGEPMPWRCHRLLVANTLAARGWRVVHLLHGGRPQAHELGRWGATPAVGPDGVVTYPREAQGPA